MKSFRSKRSLTALAIVGACLVPAARADIIYQNDFESGVGAEFSVSPITLAPNASTSFLGRFGGENPGTKLTLTGLNAHTQITLSLDVYVIHSWDGTGNAGFGPDILHFFSGSTDLLNASFGNRGGVTQSYSDATPLGGGPFDSMTDADGLGTLGYGSNFGTDTTYNMTFTFAHTDSTLVIDFGSSGLQHSDDESWGIDNVMVTSNAVPEPATMAILGLGGLALARRRRK